MASPPKNKLDRTSLILQSGETMQPKISRRNFFGNAAAVFLCSLIPRLVGASTSAMRKITVRADSEIGTVRPEFHGHFAKHLERGSYKCGLLRFGGSGAKRGF
jgi:hypothetical protein